MNASDNTLRSANRKIVRKAGPDSGNTLSVKRGLRGVSHHGYDPSQDPDPRMRRYLRAIEENDGPTAEQDNSVSYWLDVYRSQEIARERLRAERLAAGGDESLFSVIDPAGIGEPETVELSKGGVLLSSGVHRISGPAGGGKTRFAYWDVYQRIQSGERWAIFDREMGPPRYKQAMKQMGATDDDLSRIDYIDTPSSITPDLIRHGRALIRSVVARGCSGILYDSQTPFLAAAGISENDPQGVREWTVSACSGIRCAIILDHTGHSDDTRGRGTSDKAAGCDIDLSLKVLSPFAAGEDGKISIGANKDRSGTLLAGSSITIDVSCWDGGMDFQPDSWGIKTTGSMGSSVADVLGLLLLRDEFRDRDYALAGELQKAVKGTKEVKIQRIAAAVKDRSVVEREVGKSKRYSLPE